MRWTHPSREVSMQLTGSGQEEGRYISYSEVQHKFTTYRMTNAGRKIETKLRLLDF